MLFNRFGSLPRKSTCSQMNTSEKPIASRITIGAFWTVAMRLSLRAVGILSVIILARILVPDDFGIVAKASMIASFLELISEFGLTAALVQNQNATDDHYDTVWTIHVIRGALIGLILLVVAKPAAVFFREPVLTSILFFYALATFLDGLQNVGVVNFWKNLEFDLEFRFNLYKKIFSFAVTIGVAIAFRTFWAFVAGVVTGSLVGLALSFVMSSYRPRLRLCEWRSLFDFSKWVFIHGLVSSLSVKLDTFVLSRFSTTDAVGLYTVAHEIAGAASTELAMPIARAVMPGLSKLKDNSDKFRDTYTSSILILMILTLPAATGLAALSDPITLVVLGNKWLDASSLIKILAFFGIMRAVFAMSSSAFMSSGKVKTFAQLSIFNLCLRTVGLSGGFMLNGLIGLAWGAVIASMIQMTVSTIIQDRLALLGLRDLLNWIWRPLAASILMFLVLTWSVNELVWQEVENLGLSLLYHVIIGAMLYLFFLWAMWRLSGDHGGPEVVVGRFLKAKIKFGGRG